MRLVVGLGNPGEKFQKTRHNAGFMLVDELARQLGASFKESKKLKSQLAKPSQWLLVKPQTYMNLSGQAVRAVVDYYQVSVFKELILVHDDLDLKLGEFKLVFAKGPKEHNGVISVENHLRTKDFWRLRLGIDNRSTGFDQPGTDYVLSSFTQDELVTLNQVIQEAVRRILDFRF